MAKVLIMYYSKYGSTKKYAEWIASELKGDIFDLEKMNKIMYYSKFGNIEKYAKWIASDLNGNNFNLENVKHNLFINYDTIIMGSAIYAGNVKCIKPFLKNYELFKDKKIVLFTCGLADYSQAKNINSINEKIEKEIPENIREKMKIYFLRGAINYSKISFIHKLLMGLMKMMISKKGPANLNEEDRAFLETYGKTADFMDKNSIADMINYCR